MERNNIMNTSCHNNLYACRNNTCTIRDQVEMVIGLTLLPVYSQPFSNQVIVAKINELLIVNQIYCQQITMHAL